MVNVGDFVRVKNDLIVDEWYGADYFTSFMEESRGKVYCVAEVSDEGYRFKNSGGWLYTPEMVEEIEREEIEGALEYFCNSREDCEGCPFEYDNEVAECEFYYLDGEKLAAAYNKMRASVETPESKEEGAKVASAYNVLREYVEKYGEVDILNVMGFATLGGMLLEFNEEEIFENVIPSLDRYLKKKEYSFSLTLSEHQMGVLQDFIDNLVD